MEKFTIYLAGDSTVQSYRSDIKPITGWGQMLHTCFWETAPKRGKEGCDWMGFGQKSDSSFEQAICYETDGLFIDNRAMAGRSSRSFFDEGRLDDLEKSLKPGDYLFLQFAHNDANKEKEERYVTTEQYEEYLLRFINAAKKHGTQPVLVTAIAMRTFDETPDGTVSVSFPEYRDKMIELGDKYDLPVLDLGKKTADYLNAIGSEEAKKLFMWLEPGVYEAYPDGKQDNVHLKQAGAAAFAGLLAELIRAYERDGRLDKIKKFLVLPR